MSKKTAENLTIVRRFPQAEMVCAIGQFNNWSTVATPLNRIGQDVWELQTSAKIDLSRLGYFVIVKGECSGRVVRHVDRFYA